MSASFNLCDAFPRLFDLIDNSESGEFDTVAPADYQKVADACTLCDMCFMTKCPYAPPHEFNVDFPHVMLRYRAVELREGGIPLQQRELVKTDRNGRLAGAIAPLVNWAGDRHNALTRPLIEKATGIDRKAALPKFHGGSFVMRSLSSARPVGGTAPAFGRKAVLYATCFVNYNNPSIGEATRAVRAATGSKPRHSTRSAAACRNSSGVTAPQLQDRRAGWPQRSALGSTKAATLWCWFRLAL